MSILIATMVAATAVQGYSAYQQSKASNKANAFNAAIMRRNQEIAEQQALFVEEGGKKQEALFRINLESLKSIQRTGYASAGVVVGEGSAGLAVDDTAAFGELDAMTIRRNTEIGAYDIRAQGSQFGAKAGAFDAARVSPGMALATSLIGGGGRLASVYAGSQSRGSGKGTAKFAK